MPAPTDRLYTSVSQLRAYMACPRRHQLRYVLGEKPAFLPMPLAFGTAIHRGLAFVYGTIASAGVVPPADEVIAVFQDAWLGATTGPIPLRAEDGDADKPLESGKAMLTAFLRHLTAAPLPVIDAIESSFAVDLHDPDSGEVLDEQLVGAFDLIVREDDRRVVVEYKTSARRYAEDQLRYDLQLTAYQYAAAQLGLGDVGLRFQVVTKTKTPAVQIEDVHRDAQDRDDFLRTAVGVLRAIDAQAFFPVRGWQCKSCQFQDPCRRRGGP